MGVEVGDGVGVEVGTGVGVEVGTGVGEGVGAGVGLKSKRSNPHASPRVYGSGSTVTLRARARIAADRPCTSASAMQWEGTSDMQTQVRASMYAYWQHWRVGSAVRTTAHIRACDVPLTHLGVHSELHVG